MSGRRISITLRCVAVCLCPALCSGTVAEDILRADWADVDTDTSAVEQVQFGGFFPWSLGRPTFAATSRSSADTTPRSNRANSQPAVSAVSTPRRRRLARTPDMLGDSFLPQFQLTLQPLNIFNGLFATSPVVTAGGSSRTKISEHNKPLPVDRFYLNYNHFHNAVQRLAFNGFGEAVIQSENVNRFTLGGERTLRDGNASVELRLPLTSYPDLDATLPLIGPAGRFKSDSGTVGNLSLIGKHLLINAEDLIVSAGLGIEFPTGADGGVLTGETLFNLENESLFLQPFLAMSLDNGTAFVHSFLQVDVDVKGSPLSVSNIAVPVPPVGLGELQQPTLVHWDTSAGIWLFRSDNDTGLTGVAGIAEFHLSSATSAAGRVAGTVPTLGGPVNFQMGSAADRYTATYLTTGLHTEIGTHRTIRVAGVFPLRDGVSRFFDAELLLQFGSRY